MRAGSKSDIKILTEAIQALTAALTSPESKNPESYSKAAVEAAVAKARRAMAKAKAA